MDKRNINTIDNTTQPSTKINNKQFRFFQKDGTVRIERKGVAIFNRISWYNELVQMSRLKLWLTFIGGYTLVNVFFAIIYYIIGIEFIEGTQLGASWMNFAEAFFFSAQTFTTVGYGHISPTGLWTNAIAAFEAFLGLMFFAIASGIFYARFAKPKPFLLFSNVALISPHINSNAFVFRVVPYKDHYLVDAEVKLSLITRAPDGHNEFYSLPLELTKIDTLILNWTVIHPITENSPLFGKSVKDLEEDQVEIFVFLKAHDEVFATPVVARTSYTAADIVENATFKRMYHPSKKQDATVLHVEMLNEYEVFEKNG